MIQHLHYMVDLRFDVLAEEFKRFFCVLKEIPNRLIHIYLVV